MPEQTHITVTVRMTAEENRKLEEYAARTYRSKSGMLRHILNSVRMDASGSLSLATPTGDGPCASPKGDGPCA